MGFSTHIPHACAGFITQLKNSSLLEVIYYLSHSQIAKVHEQVIGMKMFIFLTSLRRKRLEAIG